MQSLRALNNKLAEMVNNFHKGSLYWVDVTHVNHPGHFYVLPRIFKQYLPALQAYAEHVSEAELRLGALVVFESMIKKGYIRGQIISIVPGTVTRCVIMALDNGFCEHSVPLYKIRKPFNNIFVPSLAFRCKLDLCCPLKSPDAEETMINALGTGRAKIVIRKVSPGLLTVDLFNSLLDDIGELLMYIEYSRLAPYIYGYQINNFVEQDITPKKFNFTFRKLQIGNLLRVRILYIESLDHFCVAEINDYKRYLQDRNDFTKYCNLQNAIQSAYVKEGLLVGVLQISNRKYERAIVKKITVPLKKAVVQLVDAGQDVEVNFSCMKLLDCTFYLTNPAIAIHCMTVKSQVWPNGWPMAYGLSGFLYVENEFLIKVRSPGIGSDIPAFVDVLPIICKL